MPSLKRTHRSLSLFILLLAGFQAFAQSDSTEASSARSEPAPPVLGDIFKPTIGIGVGNISFFGDLYNKHFQKPGTSRFGYELHLSQPLNQYLHLNFYVMFGKLGANERTKLRNENFESTIRLGGVQLMYDFSNLIKKETIRPYFLLGIEGFEFLSKTDLKDKFGNTYYYWSDGSIKNMAENSPGSQNAVDIVRDYSYDSDLRELNKDGFGKYQERSWGIPVGIGFTTKITERATFRYGATMHFTFTDYIDGITEKSKGIRKGTSANDHFMMMSASLHYDLIFKKKDKEFEDLPSNHFDNVDWLTIDKGDEDKDVVLDWDDYSHATPAGVKVDARGVPIDTDKDLIPDYRDDEGSTTLIANGRGVGITDPMAQKWYDSFYDSLGTMDPNARVVNLDSAKGKKAVDPSKQPKQFTIELARYKGGVPSDEMAFLLSIGDVQSFNLGDETVVYAAGSYEDVRMAIKRRDEFREEGLKSAKVGYFKGDNYYSLTDAELQKEIEAADKKGASVVTNPVSTKGEVVYRVQLGAYKSKLPLGVFKNVKGGVIELQTEDGYYRYCSGAYKTLEDAAVHRADMILDGYADAFVTAYRGGKRIALSEVGATYEKEEQNYKENIDEKATTAGTIDKGGVSFRVQIGGLINGNDEAFAEKISGLKKEVIKQPTATGQFRHFVGDFKSYNEAVKYKDKLLQQGYNGAFVAAFFKGELISVQEALELMK